MRKILFFLFCLLGMTSTKANYWHSVNFDLATIGVMTPTYGLEVGEEEKNLQETKDVFGDYEKIGLSVSGIFVSKWYDRKALVDTKTFMKEVGLYKHIVYLLGQQIMPHLATIGVHFLRRPDQCLYWGPYLVDITTNVENLAKQFQVVVTNNKIDFGDEGIQFLVVNRDLLNLFEFIKNHQDKDYWKKLWNKIANIGDIKDDLGRTVNDDIKGIGGTLANAGLDVINGNMKSAIDIAQQTAHAWKDATNGGDWSALGSSISNAVTDGAWSSLFKSGKAFHAKAKEVYDLYKTFKSQYDTYKNAKDAKDLLMRIVDPTGTGDPTKMVYKLFQIDRYSTTEFLKDYLNEAEDQYYRQRWYIVRIDKGEKSLVNWSPAFPNGDWRHNQNDGDWDDWIVGLWSGSHHHHESNAYDEMRSFTPSAANLNDAYDHALSKNGWSISMVNNYSTDNPGHTLAVEKLPMTAQTVSSNRKHYAKVYVGMSVIITDHWEIKSDPVYDNIFDSKTMDYDAFMQQMEDKLEEYQDQATDQWESDTHKNNDIPPYPEPKYVLLHDEKIPYSETDAEKIKGTSIVTYKASCDFGQELAGGGFAWKVNPHKVDHGLRDVAKDYAMQDANKAEDDPLQQLNSELEKTNKEIKNLEERVEDLERQINDATSEMYSAKLSKDESKYKKASEKKSRLEAEKNSYQNQIAADEKKKSEINQGITECQEDLLDDGDGDRIPTNMKYLGGMLNIKWDKPGVWVDGSDQYIYTCTGYSAMTKSDVTYTAILKESKEARFLFGIHIRPIRIHRPILTVDFKVTTGGTSDNVIETMKLDPDLSDQAKADKANDELHKLMDNYPSCKVTMEFSNVSSVDSTKSEDPFHLLWADDRLAVASKVDAELMKIATELNYLDYLYTLKESLTDYLKYRALYYVSRAGRSAISQMALERWSASADSAAIDQKFGTRRISKTRNNTESQ
ncbi:MAG: hypothetical protein PUD15_08795 [Prevotella sp.]|nr:hypothetical protein [Prevotella sp.]